MINATLNSLRTIDDELANRIRAFGPGDGINRYHVIVEDATSIAAYGVREVVQEFPAAVSVADLTQQANDYLDAHKEPITEVDITFYYDIEMQLDDILYDGEAILYNGEKLQYYRYGDAKDIRRGDTIRLVSESLNLNITGKIAEVSWEPGVINITIGKERYNLVEVLTGPEKERERKTAALGLPAPVGLRAQRAEPGCRVFVNPYVNSRATGVEIYAGATEAFTPSVANMVARGASTEFNLPQLTSGQIFYFKARSYDASGNFSEIAGPVQSASGYVQGGRIEGGTIDIDAFVGDTRPIKIVTSLPPVISGDDPDYKVGMLVNLFDPPTYEGVLFRLVSTTGVPATDWVPAVGTGSIEANTITANEIDAGSISTAILVADAIKSGMIDANVITAREISVGTITADNIAAKTITADQIANSTITGSLIAQSTISGSQIIGGTITGAQIDGATITNVNIASGTILGINIDELTITNDNIANGDRSGGLRAEKFFDGEIAINGNYSGGSRRAFSVYQGDVNAQLLVSMGDITGLAGVPPVTGNTRRYGFWGTLGTNVYIRGSIKEIGFGREKWEVALGASFANNAYTYSNSKVLIPGPYEIRTGTRILISPNISAVYSIDKGDDTTFLKLFQLLEYRHRVLSGSTEYPTFVIPAGTYSSGISVGWQASILMRQDGQADQFAVVEIQYGIYEEIL